MGVILGGNFQGESYPGWEFSLVGVFRVGTVRGNHPGGSFHVTEFFTTRNYLLAKVSPLNVAIS